MQKKSFPVVTSSTTSILGSESQTSPTKFEKSYKCGISRIPYWKVNYTFIVQALGSGSCTSNSQGQIMFISFLYIYVSVKT